MCILEPRARAFMYRALTGRTTNDVWVWVSVCFDGWACGCMCWSVWRCGRLWVSVCAACHCLCLGLCLRIMRVVSLVQKISQRRVLAIVSTCLGRCRLVVLLSCRHVVWSCRVVVDVSKIVVVM